MNCDIFLLKVIKQTLHFEGVALLLFIQVIKFLYIPISDVTSLSSAYFWRGYGAFALF